jgi:HlyD family secretion protein
MKKNLPLVLVSIVVVGIIVLCGFGSYIVKAMKNAKAGAADSNSATVTRGDVTNSIVETGTIDSVKTVEVKSRVSGRLAKLYVDEGDRVTQGQLIAVIDPLETKLLVEQNRAQLAGAVSSVQKQALEIQQRRITAQADYEQAKQRLIQLQAENQVQPTLTRSSIAQAQAALDSAIQDRDRLKNSNQPNQRVSAEASQRQAQANYDLAVNELKRQQGLLDKGFTATKVVENAQQQVDVTKAQLDLANDSLARLASQQQSELAKANEQVRESQAALISAKANSIQDVTKRQSYLSAQQDLAKAKAALEDIGIMQKGKATSQASVDQLNSVVNDAERQLGETQIKAPITGIVSKRLMQEGELVASLSSFSSGSPIVDIEDRTQMRVKLDVNEIDVAKMTINMPATVTVDALPTLKIHGSVRKISPSSDAQSAGETVVKYQVEIYLDNAPSTLRTGMSAKCSMDAQKRTNALQLPIEFVGKDGDQHFVMVAPANPKDPKAKPTKVNVQTGIETGSTIEILSGVTEGTKVTRPDFNGPVRKGMMQAGPD